MYDLKFSSVVTMPFAFVPYIISFVSAFWIFSDLIALPIVLFSLKFSYSSFRMYSSRWLILSLSHSFSSCEPSDTYLYQVSGSFVSGEGTASLGTNDKCPRGCLLSPANCFKPCCQRTRQTPPSHDCTTPVPRLLLLMWRTFFPTISILTPIPV